MKIEITKDAEKGLKKAPKAIQAKFKAWLASIMMVGLAETRKISGYHDEPLQGGRKDQRSVRLNRQWRAIYIEDFRIDIETDEKEAFLIILEVSPHDYRTK